MIDYVDEVLPGKYARGYNNMTLNQWFFPVHFSGGPNMAGALQFEDLALKEENKLAFFGAKKLINKPFFPYNPNANEEKSEAIKVIESGELSKFFRGVFN